MVSSASAQIEATAGDRLKTTIVVNGKPTVVPDYATVQGILIGVVAAFVIIVTIIGPENHGARFERHKAAFEEGGGEDDAFFDDNDDGEDEKTAGTPEGGGSKDVPELEKEKV